MHGRSGNKNNMNLRCTKQEQEQDGIQMLESGSGSYQITERVIKRGSGNTSSGISSYDVQIAGTCPWIHQGHKFYTKSEASIMVYNTTLYVAYF